QAINSGIPAEKRAIVWQLLLGYLPPVRSQRVAALRSMRSEYLSKVQKYWSHAPPRNIRMMGSWGEFDANQRQASLDSSTGSSSPLMTKESFQLHHFVAI